MDKDGFPEDISECLDQPDATVWVDLLAPDAEGLHVIAEELGLHELAVADAVNARQRPKVDRYVTHEFPNMFAVRLDTPTGQLICVAAQRAIHTQGNQCVSKHLRSK